MLVKICSIAVLGAMYSSVRTILPLAAGSAFLSILPLVVKGRWSKMTKIDGSIYSGNLPLRKSRSWLVVSVSSLVAT